MEHKKVVVYLKVSGSKKGHLYFYALGLAGIPRYSSYSTFVYIGDVSLIVHRSSLMFDV